MTRNPDEPLSPACGGCREPRGTCFPGPCKIYHAGKAAREATAVEPKPTLLDLAARVEVAGGPDREIDGAIDRLLHVRPKDGDYCEKEAGIWRVKDGWSGLCVRAGMARASFCAAAYTRSVDAAMTLVPEGCWAEGSLASPAALEIHAPMTFDPLGRGWAALPALALCAAALRARAAIGGEG